VLACAHQDAIWRRTRGSNALRSLLREYFPTFLAAFAGRTTNLAGRNARAVLAIALTPTAAAKLPRTRIAAALRRAGRQRGIDPLARQIQQALRRPQLHQPPLIEDAMGEQARALLAVLDAECDNADRLGQAVTEAFTQHPDYEIITSFPGLGDELGARLLAEIGDDRAHFADDRALKAYAGSAPITRASGRSISITRRSIKNNRLAATGFVWAFCAAAKPGPARSHYQQRRDHGDRHPAALRHLFNRMLGQLHHCLQTHQTYNTAKAFVPPTPTAA
jgi:transposase